VCGTFEITLIKNPHTRHIKQPEDKMALMVHVSVNNKNGSNLKYPKYGDFTLLFKYSPGGIEENHEKRQ
jgi:hypothetical protein